MKRYLSVILIFLLLSAPAGAAHIKGGFFTYQYLGPGSGSNLRYRITLTVYMICNPSTGQLSNPINFSIFNGSNFQFVQDVSVPITSQYNLSKNFDEPCITGNETGCYYTIVVYDLPVIELPANPGGYVVAYQRCCRIAGINNMVSSGTVGNTFAINIPGSAIFAGAETNSSPAFQVNDTAVVCRNSFFQFSFQANDPNGDSLSYSFCDAFQGGTQNAPAPTTATAPPYSVVPYQAPFSGSQPLGAGVTINPRTGMISGTAPDITGEFVVCVCVSEFRNGRLLGVTRKELHIRVGDCNPLRALLNPRGTTCDGFTVNFQNDAAGNPPDAQYLWDFGDPGSGANNTSSLATPSHTFSDTGVFVVKLRVALAGGLCADSSTVTMRVYPGFFPGFTVTGNCFLNPYRFTDTTRTSYGVVDSWRWDFGDAATLADTSRIRNPQYTYPGPGIRTVRLIVTNSKGCIDTAFVDVDVLDKPLINLAFRDTLICIPDAVTLSATSATGAGSFSWTPLSNISNPNTATPTVNPTTTTWYTVTLNDNGCINRDSVRVRVISFVTLVAMNDTTICLTDPVQLTANTDGLSFTWTPASTLNNPAILNPIATPTDPVTVYTLISRVGSCVATDQVTVRTVPYPVANAGPDQTICYNTSAQLNGSHNGSSFTWTPASYLNNPGILNPVSSPPRTTTYVLSSFDTRGCPKPGRDTVLITVQPRVRANAGRDTIVVVGQPMQFNGSGGVTYAWSPATGLNNPFIPNPIGTYTAATDSVRYKMVTRDAAGCADSAFVTVRVFKTNPTVFVPSAFTPNNDGRNDVIRPISVGIQRIRNFSIYNRWGQRVFSTNEDRRGWDGTIGGVPQGSGVYVWMLQADDYLGNAIFLKGTVTLIR